LSISNWFDTRFSPDGRFLIADSYVNGEPCLRWWDAATGRPIQSVPFGSKFALIAGGRILATVPSAANLNELLGPYTVQFWDLATGASLGNWDLDGAICRTNEFDNLGNTLDGRYIAGVFKPEYYYRPTPWERISDSVNKTAFGWAPEDRTRVVLWNLDERKLEARLPGGSFAFSPSGMWLATVDKEGVIRTYPVPLQKPWSRILVWSGSAAAAGMALVALLAHLIRTVWQFQPVRWLRTGRRRWVTIPIAAFLFLAVVGVAWDDWATSQARDEVTAICSELQHRSHFTEAEVTAFIGQPPDSVPVAIPASLQFWSGDLDHSVGRRWTRYGAALNVAFRSDGTIQGAGSIYPRTMVEKLADWMEK
jgi:hypothetical protein